MKTYFLPIIGSLLLLNFTTGSCKKNEDGAGLTSVSVIEASALEDSEVLVSVKLQKAVGKPITVHYTTEDGNAKAGDDYTAVTGELTFAPGETEQNIKLAIVADTIREGDEFFYVKLTHADNAQLGANIARVILLNDDTYVLLPDAGFVSPASYPGYQLKWSDEFAGKSLNTDNWTFDLGDGCPNVCGWGNNELEWYTNNPDNVFLSDGRLIIEARRESAGGKNYTSSRLKTQGKKSFKYGRIDIRAILPIGKGIWPALWMLGDNITTVGWPACGEIDIMEYLGHEPDRVHGTGHWGASLQAHQYKGNSILAQGPDFNKAWHVFSLIWKENEITWLVDDQPFFTVNPSVTGSHYPFNNSFFFIFNVAVGGNWPGNPDGETVFPQRMAVDYVRVFEEI